MQGKHGEKASGTEVPRISLLRALEAETVLQNTEDLKLGLTAPLCYGLRVTSGRAPAAFDTQG
jgi:hypothetical protein